MDQLKVTNKNFEFYLNVIWIYISRPKFRKQIVVKSIKDINDEVLVRRNTNYAYIFVDFAADYTDMLLHGSPSGYNSTMRIMKEKLGKYKACAKTKSFR